MIYTEYFYQTALNNMLNGFAYHKIVLNEKEQPIDYIFLEVNKAFENLTGLRRENIIGKRVTEVLPGIDQDQFGWIEYYGKVALTGEEKNFTQYSNELSKCYSVNVYSPEKGYFITIFNDVTDYKNKEHELINQRDEVTSLYEELTATEEELRQQVETLYEYSEKIKRNEDRLKRAQSIAHVGNWELDITDMIYWASDEFYNLFGLNHETPFITYEYALNMTVKEDRSKKEEALKHLIEKQDKYDIEFRIIRPCDGAERIIHSVAELECDNLGNPKKVLGVITDVTETKKANEIAAKYSLLSSDTRDIIFFMLQDGTIIDSNEAAVDTYGYSYEELRHMNIKELRHPETLSVFSAQLQQARSEGVVFETIHSRKDGTSLPVEVSSQTSIFNGNPLVVSIVRDITERKQMDMELIQAKNRAEAANEAKSMFLANMSHEIRTPMNGMLGMIQLAQIALTKDESNDYLQIAKSSANSLLAVINEILDYSKIEAGKLHIEKTPFNIREVMNEMMELFSVNAKEKNIDLSLQMDFKTPSALIGDSIRLRQILSNLIGNAMKFTKDGNVSIKVKVLNSNEKTTEIKLSVEDTGIGIPNDKLEQIFESFSQVNSSYNKEFGGTGLGLAISRSLVKQLGGDIGVISELGVGSNFFFTLPFDNLSNPISSEYSQYDIITKEQNENINLKIMLVEDDKINQMILQKYLIKQGFQITTAENGLEAVNEFKKQQFDIILMDIQMPLMDGFKATSSIRSTEIDQGRHTPIIALTAYAMSKDREKCLEAGMDDYISKPINFELLMTIIKKWKRGT